MAVTTTTNIESLLSRSERLLIEKIRSSLTKERDISKALNTSGTLPKAAVSAILRPESSNGKFVLLLVRRTLLAGDPWSGHMALPGGRYIERDKDILSTAAREAMEETGIDIRQCEIIGALHEVVPTNLQIRVVPFIVLAPGDTNVKLDLSEIERFFWIPLSYFRDRRNITPYDIVRFGVKAQVPSYRFPEGYVIWGMTFRIIQDLIERMGSESIE